MSTVLPVKLELIIVPLALLQMTAPPSLAMLSVKIQPVKAPLEPDQPTPPPLFSAELPAKLESFIMPLEPDQPTPPL